MVKKGWIIVADYSDDTHLSVDELCEICETQADIIYDLIRYEIIHPSGGVEAEWTFDLAQLNRVKKALRLQHDLEMNLSGVAVVLDLLDEMQELRAKMQVLEKHFL